MHSSPNLRELSATVADLEILRRFYDDLFVAEFPDPDERESYDNIVLHN
jgi:hypothetical protein